MTHSVKPHGGALVDLLADEEQAESLKQRAKDFVSITLTRRQLCDLELLLNGSFSPLTGFMTRADYESVVADMRLADGMLWPIPIVLDVAEAVAADLRPGQILALRDEEGFMPAVLEVSEVWEPDRRVEAAQVYGSTDTAHPGVDYLLSETRQFYVGGKVIGVEAPVHYEFENLWHSPEELRALFKKLGWRRVLGFQTSRSMHRLQRELVVRLAKENQAHVLVHPTVGVTKPGDPRYYARVHCYQAVMQHMPHNLAELSLLPLAMRMAGPRESVLHAIVQQNCGCTHAVIGPHHASPPHNGHYEAYASQALLQQYESELDIEILPIEEFAYSRKTRAYLPQSEIKARDLATEEYDERDLRNDLCMLREPPAWFSYDNVLQALRRVYPPRSAQGFTLFFTGLSGAGKSTLARIVYAKLIEEGSRPVTLLDGDIVRLNLSSELGFSKVHRNLNIRRIGFVAAEITKNRGIAICAPIAPYRETRRYVRQLIEQDGAFIEIHVATPLDVCESRDRKGLYAKAREGIIPEFTGVSDPYEAPEAPELKIDTSEYSPMEAAQEIFLYLFKEGYLAT